MRAVPRAGRFYLGLNAANARIYMAARREAGLKNLFKMISVRRVWFRRQSLAPCAP